VGEIFRRVRYLINRRRFDAELESDMEFHREMAARAGYSNFGNTLRMREQAREPGDGRGSIASSRTSATPCAFSHALPASHCWPCWCWPSASASMSPPSPSSMWLRSSPCRFAIQALLSAWNAARPMPIQTARHTHRSSSTREMQIRCLRSWA
jgi:hypothetical protein